MALPLNASRNMIIVGSGAINTLRQAVCMTATMQRERELFHEIQCYNVILDRHEYAISKPDKDWELPRRKNGYKAKRRSKR